MEPNGKVDITYTQGHIYIFIGHNLQAQMRALDDLSYFGLLKQESIYPVELDSSGQRGDKIKMKLLVFFPNTSTNKMAIFMCYWKWSL